MASYSVWKARTRDNMKKFEVWVGCGHIKDHLKLVGVPKAENWLLVAQNCCYEAPRFADTLLPTRGLYGKR